MSPHPQLVYPARLGLDCWAESSMAEVRRGRCHLRQSCWLRASLLDAVVAPVTREKSQFRAQHDSLSLSPAHDGTSLYLNFRALAALLLWAAYFSPQHHAGANECGTFAPVLFLFALHPQSCRSHCSVRLKRASAHSRSIANWFSISGYADRPSKGNHPSAPARLAGCDGPGT